MPGFTSFAGGRVATALDIEGFTSTVVATSVVAAQSGVLEEGIYNVFVDAVTYLRIAPTATSVTTANGCPQAANTVVQYAVRAGSRIGGILGASTGNLIIHRVG